MAPYPSTEETTRLLELVAAFGIPTEHMRASPGIQLDEQQLRLAPEFVWRVEDLTAEQVEIIEKTLRTRVAR